MAAGRFGTRHDNVIGDGHARRLHHDLGLMLVHCESGRQYARMGVRQLDQFEQPLHHTAFAEHAVQRVERNIGLEFSQDIGDVAPHINFGHLIPGPPQRARTFGTGRKRYRALVGPASHENGDVFGHDEVLVSAVAGIPPSLSPLHEEEEEDRAARSEQVITTTNGKAIAPSGTARARKLTWALARSVRRVRRAAWRPTG